MLISRLATILKAHIVFLLCLSFFGCASNNSGEESQNSKNKNKPNIVWIISDDQAFGDFGFMGHPIIKTPHIDKLANESALFRNGYVPTSLCRASLMTLLTGKYSFQHKVTFNDPPKSGPRSVTDRLLDAQHSMPKMLAEAGYKSLQTGKFWEGHYSKGGFTHGMTQGTRHGDEGLKIGRKTMQPIKDFIDDAGNDPFFIWFAPYLPHAPFNAEEKYLNLYKNKGLHEKEVAYYANINWLDDTVADLMQILEAKGVADNTIIMFVVDNGWASLNDEPRWRDYQDRPLKFHSKSKQSQYENGVRTPVFIWWPDEIKPGDYDDFVSSIDFMPTTLKMAGLDIPSDLPGLNLLDRAKDNKALDRDAVYGGLYFHNAVEVGNPSANVTHRWMRQGPWKLIVDEIKQTDELFNLALDPKEENNRAEEAGLAGLKKQLKQKLNNWWTPER